MTRSLILFLAFFLFLPTFMVCQNSQSFADSIVLHQDQILYHRGEIESIKKKIEMLKLEQAIAELDESQMGTIITHTIQYGSLRNKPTALSEIIMSIPEGMKLTVLGYEKTYWKVLFNQNVGYINEMYLEITPPMTVITEAGKAKVELLKYEGGNSSDKNESKTNYNPPAGKSKSIDVKYSYRCQATTQKGSQCKRNAASGSSYCWQH